MRCSLILPIFIILLVTLVLLGINYFFPFLTPERCDNQPYLLFTALVAALTLVSGYMALTGGKGGITGQVKIDEKQAKRLCEDILHPRVSPASSPNTGR